MKNKINYIIVMGILSLLIVGCTDEPKQSTNIDNFQYTNYLDNLELDNVQVIETKSSTKVDASIVENLRDLHDHVFVGTVDSIDGASASVDGNYLMAPYTFGKITVLNNLKGTVKTEKIDYARYGGTISIAEYEKNAPQEMLDNDKQHRKENGDDDIDKANTYMTYLEAGDITLDSGKTYVFFGNFTEAGTFVIDGFQYGARELYQPESESHVFRTMPEENKLKIFNYETNEYESYQDFVSLYFN